MIEVKKDFLDNNIFSKLKKEIQSNYFPWFFQTNMTKENDGENFIFTHTLFEDKPNSNYLFLFNDLIKKINLKSLIRLRANLSLNLNKRYFSNWHVDQKFECKIAIFYINNNNGYTEIMNDSNDIIKIDCEENKILIFDSYHKHRLVSQTNTQTRIALNFNYY